MQHQFTTPHTPQQNGVAERMNRTLMERARAMINDSKMDKKFWNEAIYCATYLINRSPTNAIGEKFKCETPAEIWFGKRPNANKFHVFGCDAFTHIPDQKRKKIDMKSEKNTFVGYAPNGFRLWSPTTNKIIVARDIVFHEKQLEKSPPEIEETIRQSNQMQNNQEKDQPQMSDKSETTEEKDESNVGETSMKETVIVSSGDEAEFLTPIRRQSRKPERYGENIYDCATLALNAMSCVDDSPENYSEISGREDSDDWMAAIQSELNSLEANKTWTLVELPPGRTAIDNKWVFRRKLKPNGEAGEYKARLVAKGFSQKFGFDYKETFAPVAKMTTLRILLSLANVKNLLIHQMDVKTAFLNGNLNEEIFMKQPKGFENGKLVCRLNKSLYGLKQASRMWNERFHLFVTKIGFIRSKYDYCLYTLRNDIETLHLLLYVDDLLLIGKSLHNIKKLKDKLSMEFDMKDMKEAKHFLGISIDWNNETGTMSINQTAYLKSMLKRFSMENCSGVHTPMETNLKLTKANEKQHESLPYRELIGCLIYVAITSRPDLCAATNYFSQFQSCATHEHWKHLKRILRYIQNTIDLKLVFERETGSPLVGYADADWANDINDRKSISGYVFKVFGTTVSWSSRKQATVSLSSTEAEFIALSSAACEAKWIGNLLNELSIDLVFPIKIFEDNQACIQIARNPKEHGRMKHIDVKHNHVREMIDENLIEVIYISTNEQLADIMTKALNRTKFEYLRRKLNLN